MFVSRTDLGRALGRSVMTYITRFQRHIMIPLLRDSKFAANGSGGGPVL